MGAGRASTCLSRVPRVCVGRCARDPVLFCACVCVCVWCSVDLSCCADCARGGVRSRAVEATDRRCSARRAAAWRRGVRRDGRTRDQTRRAAGPNHSRRDGALLAGALRPLAARRRCRALRVSRVTERMCCRIQNIGVSSRIVCFSWRAGRGTERKPQAQGPNTRKSQVRTASRMQPRCLGQGLAI